MQYIQKFGRINILVISLLALSLTWLGVMSVAAASTSAQGVKSNLCEGADLTFTEGNAESCNEETVCLEKRGEECIRSEAKSVNKLNNLVTTIVNILSVVVGIIAVIAIIIGGAKFITSGGDSGKVSSAKNTVLYAIIGLIIVALAQFIVRFVLSKT